MADPIVQRTVKQLYDPPPERDDLIRHNAKLDIFGDMYGAWEKGECPWCGTTLGREFSWGSHVFQGCSAMPDAIDDGEPPF